MTQGWPRKLNLLKPDSDGDGVMKLGAFVASLTTL